MPSTTCCWFRLFRRPAAPDRYPHPADPGDLADIPLVAAAMDTVTEAPHGDRHGPGRRHRRGAQEHDARGTGRPGPPGQEIRSRHGGEPRHHPSRPDPGRCPRPAGPAPISGIPVVERGKPGSRRWSASSPTATSASPPTRHPGLRADDPGQPDHRQCRHHPGTGARAAAPPPDREAAGGGRCRPLRRADHRQGHGQGPGQSECGEGCAGPPARRRRHRRGRGWHRAGSRR